MAAIVRQRANRPGPSAAMSRPRGPCSREQHGRPLNPGDTRAHEPGTLDADWFRNARSYLSLAARHPSGRLVTGAGSRSRRSFPSIGLTTWALSPRTACWDRRKRKWSSGCLTNTFADVIHSDVGVVCDGRRFTRFRGSLRGEILDKMLPWVVDARRPRASAQDARHLDRVSAGGGN